VVPFTPLGSLETLADKNASATEKVLAGLSFIPIVRGTKGLAHSFGSHAEKWFGRALRAADEAKWLEVVERAAATRKGVDWLLKGQPVIAKLARVEGRYIIVTFYKEGPLAGQLASAWVPSARDLTAILAKLAALR
jgi:hypothetical protein